MTSPVDQLLGFKRNTKLYAALRLLNGEAHPAEHFLIAGKLASWRRQVQAAGPGAELLCAAREIVGERARDRVVEAANRMVRAWIMPNGRVTGLGAETVEPPTPEGASAPRGGPWMR